MTTQHDPHFSGDPYIRIPRDSEIEPVEFEVSTRSVSTRGFTSPMSLVYGFAIADVIGTALLMLPFASNTPGSAHPLTALFTATSAITVTGLATVDTDVAWTGFGQAVIMFLIFIGGLGFMTGTAFLLILFGQELGLRNRLIIQTGLGGGALSGIAVTVRNIFILTVAIQLLGFGALWVHWNIIRDVWPDLSLVGNLWQAFFHAVSSFNNAGMDIMPDAMVGGASLAGFRTDYGTLAITCTLIILGGLGYAVMSDMWIVKRFRRFTLETKIVLLGTALLLTFGVVSYMAEWDNSQTSGDEGVGQKIADAAFHAVVTRSAGFATIDYGKAQGSTDLTTELLMFVGAASGSTGGGIKVNTFVIIVAAVIITMSGRSAVNAFGRQLPTPVVTRALAVGLSAIAIVFSLVFALAIAEDDLPFRASLFEVVSAFGTVGLSTGITSSLGAAGQIILVVAMFLGRFGPLTLGLLMAGRQVNERFALPEEEVRIG